MCVCVWCVCVCVCVRTLICLYSSIKYLLRKLWSLAYFNR